jgi:quercetin dioxygenase-like cupin family protein
MMTKNSETPSGMPAAEAVRPTDMVAYAPGSVVSRTLVKSPAGTVTLFAFDAGQELSEHTAPFDAIVHLLQGTAEFTVGGTPIALEAGEALRMPAGVPHAVRATGAFKMLLVMIRGEEESAGG